MTRTTDTHRQLRSTFITQCWGLQLTSGLTYTSLLPPAAPTWLLSPCAGQWLQGSLVLDCPCASTSVCTLSSWTSKNNTFLSDQKGFFFLCIKPQNLPYFHLTQKNFFGEKNDLHYFLEDISDVINSNEKERLISCCGQKAEVCVKVKNWLKYSGNPD